MNEENWEELFANYCVDLIEAGFEIEVNGQKLFDSRGEDDLRRWEDEGGALR